MHLKNNKIRSKKHKGCVKQHTFRLKKKQDLPKIMYDIVSYVKSDLMEKKVFFSA